MRVRSLRYDKASRPNLCSPDGEIGRRSGLKIIWVTANASSK